MQARRIAHRPLGAAERIGDIAARNRMAHHVAKYAAQLILLTGGGAQIAGAIRLRAVLVAWSRSAPARLAAGRGNCGQEAAAGAASAGDAAHHLLRLGGLLRRLARPRHAQIFQHVL